MASTQRLILLALLLQATNGLNSFRSAYFIERFGVSETAVAFDNDTVPFKTQIECAGACQAKDTLNPGRCNAFSFSHPSQCLLARVAYLKMGGQVLMQRLWIRNDRK